MLERCRFISGRSLLNLEKLDRCQDLLVDTWTPVDELWHVVFISHRWGSQDDPDPMGTQLLALQRLVRRMVDIRSVLADERVRLLSGDGILDLIGFWYDFSCLPQEPRTVGEEQEFRRSLVGIGEMLESQRVSTLVLRKEGDGYLERGWCFAESMIAGAKEDVFKPMILRTDRWDEPLVMQLEGAFGALRPEVMAMLGQWEDVVCPVGAEKAFENAVNGTALLMLAKMENSMAEFVVAVLIHGG
jgi:hypothetical protein